MRNQSKKSGIVSVTLVSALLFCSVLVSASLSSVLGVIIFCSAVSLTNIIWFFVAFRSNKMSTYTLNVR
ncbi:hypothetical protein COL91_05985 [Bacillus pseudomycoides]|nr:hypothetical protein COO02_06210 [Bacillus pseudomycoides]PGA92664.1 hypothetical protein COL91_05985 [Bacillus pseudomycoides]PHF49072.1 hypothetical protein COF72_08775 [Bacillus pseudomycoides]